MRLIGHLKNESSAKTLADYLLSMDIRNQVELDSDGWGVWVFSEDQIEAGREALASFVRNPGDSRFRNAAKNAAAVDERERREKAEFDKRVRTAGQIWTSASIGPVTLTLIIISVAVTLVFLGTDSPIINWLFISQYSLGLPEVRHGQILALDHADFHSFRHRAHPV